MPITILNDEVPNLTIAGSKVRIVVPEGASKNVVYKLSNDYYQNFTISLLPVNGTAVAPGDYTTGPSSLVIPAGLKAGTTSVNARTDHVTEGDEQYTLVATPLPGGPPVNLIVAIPHNHS